MKKILLCEQLFRQEVDLFKQRADLLGIELDAVDPITSSPVKKEYSSVLVRTYRSFNLIEEFLETLPGYPAIFGFDPSKPLHKMDKLEDMRLLESFGVRIPETYDKNPGGQVVEKSFWGYGGQGVSLVGDNQSREMHFYQKYLEQQQVDYRVYDGLDFLVVRSAAPGDFRSNKYQGGNAFVMTNQQARNQLGNELVDDIFEQSQKSIECLDRYFSAVDLKVQDDKAYVLEVNRTPRIRIESDFAHQVTDSWLGRLAF